VPWVTLDLEKGYMHGLVHRMQRHGISQNALARMLGRNPSQVSRWFTRNEARRVTPDMETVARIETLLQEREEAAISYLEEFVHHEPGTWNERERERAQSSLSIMMTAFRLLQERGREDAQAESANLQTGGHARG
jgi:predicted transcriptional regulator